MGTNYYVRTPTCEDACDHCSESELVHLGKSSMGWKFGFAANPEWPRDKALERWLDLAQSGQIENEYGTYESLGSLLSWIMVKQDGRSHTVNHGVDITGPYYDSFKHHYFLDKGFDFCDSEFS